MTDGNTAASNLVYDLISVQYHALKASQLYDQFAKDAQGNSEAEEFFRQCKQQDDERATKVHELLTRVTQPA
jgi:pyrroloquinoline quinone (PQQ) biosynthesis protein C